MLEAVVSWVRKVAATLHKDMVLQGKCSVSSSVTTPRLSTSDVVLLMLNYRFLLLDHAIRPLSK
jgi:hypothetical protein